VAATAEDVRAIAEELGGRVVVKSQVLVGGRGKAGGIRLAKTSQEAMEVAASVLEMEIKGLPVRKVLIDEAVDIAAEIYLGVTNDRAANSPVMISSAEGGVDIEEVARTDPRRIVRMHIDPLIGWRDYQGRDLASTIELPRKHWRAFMTIAQGLYDAYVSCDATLAEINPLVITKDGRLLALDGKMVIDDNSLYRHPEIAEMRDINGDLPEERQARKFGLSYVKLDGDIGCLVNGAGLAMATMDVIKLYGGEPANFLDIGGGASADKVSAALGIILQDPGVKVVLINIFGGITRGDEVARGIMKALKKLKPQIPIVARLAGTNEEEGQKLLAKTDLIMAKSLAGAAQEAVSIVQEVKQA
jgi:succinyl-CoA synthetase beta subunit